MVIRTLHGFDLWIDPSSDSGVERSIYDTGTYEKGTLQVIERMLPERGVFVDIGANIGLMTVLAARLVGPQGRVIAFEPNPVARAILERNVRINDLTQVQVSPMAIGSIPSRSTIYEGVGSNRGRATLVQPSVERVGQEVEVVRLSDVVHAEDRMDLVKMDIEGFELEALKGMSEILARPEPPMLIVECSGGRENSFGRGSDPIFEHLIGLGKYRLFRGRSGKERLSPLIEVRSVQEMPDHDNLHCMTTLQVERAGAAGLLA
ncbi:MAG TPA: FkbM family methyltransferase [Flavobacteriales bacterium]